MSPVFGVRPQKAESAPTLVSALADGPSNHQPTETLSVSTALPTEYEVWLAGKAVTPEVINALGIRLSVATDGAVVIPWQDATFPNGYVEYIHPDHRVPGQGKVKMPTGQNGLGFLRIADEGGRILVAEGIGQSLAALHADDSWTVVGMNGADGVHGKTNLSRFKGAHVVISWDADREDPEKSVRGAVGRVYRLMKKAGAASIRLINLDGYTKSDTDGLDDVLARSDDPATLIAELIDTATEAGNEVRENDVQDAVYRIEVGDEAKRRVAAKRAADYPDPDLIGLGELLEEPDDDEVFRVDKLWLSGGNVVLVAQYKSGKTTMLGNVVRCLVDGGPFLGGRAPGARFGRYKTTPAEPDRIGFHVEKLADGERVAVLDLELDRRTLRRWLSDQDIENTGAVYAEALRGRVSEFDVMDDNRRAKWAAHLKSLGVRVLLIDPLAPLLASYGIDENDNTGVAGVLSALDQLKAEAGITELMVTHHMGHSGERSRGASRLRDWPDATWTLVREGKPGEEPPPDAARFLSAMGRDVALTETRLDYDVQTRRYTAAGGTRTAYTLTKWGPAVLKVVEDKPGIGKAELEAALGKKGVKQAEARKAISMLANDGDIHVHAGKNRSQNHYPGFCKDVCPGANDGSIGRLGPAENSIPE